MKILAIGDFHGKFPQKLARLIWKEKPDLILSTGDFFPWSLKQKFFQKSYGRTIELWEIVGKKKFMEATLNDLKIGEENVLKKLDSLKVPVFTTTGNYDLTDINDQYYSKNWKSKWRWINKDLFSGIIKNYKNIRRIDYSSFDIGDFALIGAGGLSSPGSVKSPAFRKYKKIADNLFRTSKKDVIFVSHNCPYNTKLDKINSKKADKQVRGKHFGSKLIKRVIEKHQPFLAICGHMHENFGTCRIGKTIVVNPGAVVDGRAALIFIDERKKRVLNVKFVR